MEVNCKLTTYNDLLLRFLNKEENIDLSSFEKEFELNIYLTLLSLSNLKYKESIYIEEHTLVENFLRKINNLKVKIQLKRKDEEINKLIDEIKDIYNNNQLIIPKYNQENLDINGIIDLKDASNITMLIDKLTKEKMSKSEKKEEYDKLREKISNSIFINEYYIEDDILYIETDDNISVSLKEFYEIFDYLLNIDTYGDTFKNKQSNRLHTTLVSDIIKVILCNDKIDDLIIPIVLTYLLSKKVDDYSKIDTSSFTIQNIKITELYSLANPDNQTDDTKTAKWNKIKIPNEYLFNQVNEIIKKGMYYFKEDKFILENIDNDFKISIQIDKMLEFLKESLNNINKLDIPKRVK